MAAGRRPPRHNRLTRRRDAEQTRQSNPPPTGDPQKTDPIRANRARDALVLATATAQSSSGRERPSPSYEKCALVATWEEMPRSPGHAFYDRLQNLLGEAGFDAFVEGVCKPYYAARMGAPSLPPGRYFRMHMIGYFEGIDSERGMAWRCADSFSLRDFLRLSNREKVPDLAGCRTRARVCRTRRTRRCSAGC